MLVELKKTLLANYERLARDDKVASATILYHGPSFRDRCYQWTALVHYVNENRLVFDVHGPVRYVPTYAEAEYLARELGAALKECVHGNRQQVCGPVS